MRPLIFWGLAHAGRVQPEDRASVSARLQKWEGKRVLVRVEPEPDGKTASQLGYIFGVIIREWAEHLGYDEDELYEVIIATCMPSREVVNPLTGEVLRYQPRLSQATKEEASVLIDNVIREAAGTGFPVPLPSYRA